jgi:hypothetical protein
MAPHGPIIVTDQLYYFVFKRALYPLAYLEQGFLFQFCDVVTSVMMIHKRNCSNLVTS